VTEFRLEGTFEGHPVQTSLHEKSRKQYCNTVYQCEILQHGRVLIRLQLMYSQAPRRM